jgi:cytochrome c-type biogenesis protein CcmH
MSKLPFTRPLTSVWTRTALVLVVALAFMGAGDTNAQRVSSLGHQIMCACGCGQILLECNHVGCRESDHMRAELQAAVDSGSSDSGVLNTFVQKYGNTILAAPTTTGFNIVAWIMPFAALFIGLALTWWIVRRWQLRPTPATPAPATGPQLDELRRRAREETEL